MKSIRILKETTNHWKGVSAGTVIAMMNDEDADSVIQNGEGELVDQGTATSLHLREITDKQLNMEEVMQGMLDEMIDIRKTLHAMRTEPKL